jgi:hypothetical protein
MELVQRESVLSYARTLKLLGREAGTTLTQFTALSLVNAMRWQPAGIVVY